MAYFKDLGDGTLDADSSGRSIQRSRNLSESYLSFKGAAIILPQSECLRTITKGINTDIHTHLQSMFYLLRPQDTIKMAIKLESMTECLVRYLAVVSSIGVQDTEESVIVGVDIRQQEATIGLVQPVWADMAIKLDGDGGFTVTTNLKHHIFKPVSVQAMWSAWQSLNKIHDLARIHSYYTTGLTHTWVQYYKINSPQECINEWNLMEDLESQRPEVLSKSSDSEQLEHHIRAKLKEIMMTVDLEEVTSLYVRKRLEEALDMSLKMYKQFIDQEMIVIMRQMDSPSQIFDFLYLGSEWNASNLEELNKNKIGYILNVTREIDNFFPGLYTYKNIRVYDVEETDLLKHWEQTYFFICKARKNKSKALVHCKMGVSRSASTVIAFAMKDNNWTLDEALRYVKNKRSVIHPNDGFMKQLKIYEGILGASNQRHSNLWRSSSTGNLQATASQQAQADEEELYKGTDLAHPPNIFGTFRHDSLPMLIRPQSWSPHDNAADILLKAHGFASREESSDESLDLSEDDQEDPEPVQFLLEGDPESSSQSVDEWDEAFHDNTAGGSEGKEGSLPAPVVLISCLPRGEEVEPERDKVDSDSESEDGIELEVGSKHVTGGYDVAMLEAAQDEALYPAEAQTSPDVKSVSDEWSSLLRQHPDMILELALIKHRNQQMMAQLMQLHSKPGSRQRSSTPQVIVSEAIKHSTNQVPSAASVRVKPDDFWIKDEPPSVSHDQSEPSEDCDKNDELIVLTKESLSQSPQASATDHSPVGSINSDFSESMQPYIKEAIPWSPGTVRRQAQDLEGRMTTSDIPIMSDLSSSPQSQCRAASGITQPCKDSDLTGTTTPSPSDGQPRDFSPSGPLSSCDGCHSDGGSTASTSLESLNEPLDQGQLGMNPSVYKSEDIPMEPGHVLRTKLEIEHRERSCSFKEMSPEKETQSVQRSSSCKDDRRSTSRSRFDRSSERRKTCLPVLNPSPVDEKSFNLSMTTDNVSLQVPGFTRADTSDSNTDQEQTVCAAQDVFNTSGPKSDENASKSDGGADRDEGQVVTYNICDEAVEIEEGKVKRQARGGQNDNP